MLFALLFTVAVLALTSWSIRGAAQTAQLNVRQALGGTFTVEPNSSNAADWGSSSVGTGSRALRGEPLTADFVREVVEGGGGRCPGRLRQCPERPHPRDDGRL